MRVATVIAFFSFMLKEKMKGKKAKKKKFFNHNRVLSSYTYTLDVVPFVSHKAALNLTHFFLGFFLLLLMAI